MRVHFSEHQADPAPTPRLGEESKIPKSNLDVHKINNVSILALKMVHFDLRNEILND